MPVEGNSSSSYEMNADGEIVPNGRFHVRGNSLVMDDWMWEEIVL